MDFFKDVHDISKSEYLDSKNKLSNYMIEANLASEKTIDKRIAFFKKCMYYCSSCHANPAFHTLAKDALKLNDELINIHELMYKYFVKEQHCLNFTVLTRLDDKYAPSSFSWYVSPITLPFLAACISASGSCKSTTTISAFFRKLYDEFKMTTRYSQSHSNTPSTKEKLKYLSCNQDNVFECWADTVLGKSYFCILEGIFRDYSRNEKQKIAIRMSIYSLTRILIENSVSSNKISQYVSNMLDKYRLHLNQTIKSNSKNLTLLYPYEFSRKITEELDFSKELYKTFSDLTQDILSFIDTYTYSPKSKYKFSVIDFDSYQAEYNKYSKQFNDITVKIKNDLIAFFKEIKENYDTAPYIQFNDLYSQKHIKEISAIFSQCHKNIKKSLDNFLSIVKKESSPNPAKYKNLTVDHDYLEELKNDIHSYLRKLKEKLEKKLSDLPGILNCYNPGAVNEWKYPIDLFYEHDIIRIINELSSEYVAAPPATKIIDLLIANHVKFPMRRASVIIFLQKYEEIVSKLD